MPEEPRDLYSDQFQSNLAAYGCTLNFSLSSHQLPAPGTLTQPTRQATIRMSLEHLKVMVFILRRQVLQYERETGVKVEVPTDLLNNLHISREEDWAPFWR